MNVRDIKSWLERTSKTSLNGKLLERWFRSSDDVINRMNKIESWLERTSETSFYLELPDGEGLDCPYEGWGGHKLRSYKVENKNAFITFDNGDELKIYNCKDVEFYTDPFNDIVKIKKFSRIKLFWFRYVNPNSHKIKQTFWRGELIFQRIVQHKTTTISTWLEYTSKSYFDIELPSGWIGRPNEGMYEIKTYKVVDKNIFIMFNEGDVLNIYDCNSIQFDTVPYTNIVKFKNFSKIEFCLLYDKNKKVFTEGELTLYGRNNVPE